MNVFKLVSLDSPDKIDLPLGKFVFGRGRLVKCDDKRVSRNHGELLVSQNSITLRSLHLNPCFYMKDGSKNREVLQLEHSVVLGNGDRLGVLPDICWYELVHCPNTSLAIQPTDIPSTEENNSELDNQTQLMNSSSNNSQNDDTRSDHSGSQPLDITLNEATSNTGDTSQSLIPNEDVNDGIVGQRTPQKRCNPITTSPVDVKKVKQEPEVGAMAVSTSPDDAPDVKPGPSKDSVATNSNTNDTKDDSLDSLAHTNGPQLRERCMYGANCYRRNPQHKAQFSHPCDADWGPGAQAPCPAGAGCARRDPRHWRDHTHPPGTQRPGLRPDGKPKKRQRVNHTSQDSTEDPLSEDVVVTGTRTRNTIQTVSWSDSDSNDDPYKTDEDSDEWQPSSVGYSQDTAD